MKDPNIFMNNIIEKNESRIVYACDPKFCNGESTLYEPIPGISLVYTDCTLVSTYKSTYDNTFDLSDSIELNYCLNGKFICEFHDQTIVYITDGDFCIWSGKGDFGYLDTDNIWFKGITVHIEIEEAKRFLRQFILESDIDFSNLMNDIISGNNTIIGKPSPKIQNIFTDLYDLPEKYTLDYMRIKLIELILLILTKDTKSIIYSHRNYPKSVIDSVKNTRNYIDDYFYQKITILELSKRNSINPNQLMEAFKYVYNMTINECIQLVRVSNGAKLLEETDLKIVDIALMIGYSSASKFSETFKNFYSTTPFKYRNSVAEKIKVL